MSHSLMCHLAFKLLPPQLFLLFYPSLWPCIFSFTWASLFPLSHFQFTCLIPEPEVIEFTSYCGHFSGWDGGWERPEQCTVRARSEPPEQQEQLQNMVRQDTCIFLALLGNWKSTKERWQEHRKSHSSFCNHVNIYELWFFHTFSV